MSNPQAEIDLQEEIPLMVSVVDNQGTPVSGATVSNVFWTQDLEIGEITADPTDASKAVFVPTKAGTTHITATAVVTVP